MKNKLNAVTILFLALFSLLHFACKKEHGIAPAEDKWINLHAPYCGKPLSINFINDDQGCILGHDFNNGEDQDIILKTFDGGKTWESISLSGRFLVDSFGSMLGGASFYPYDSSIMFAGGTSLLRSTDGGKHWQKLNTSNRIRTTNIHFFDPANAIGVGGSEISKTTDSGKTWQTVYKSNDFAFGFTMLQFTSSEIGYAAGGTAFDATNFGVMAKTTDGGNTWQEINYAFKDIIGISFLNDSVGYVTVNMQSGNIATTYYNGTKLLKTEDGGKTWITINSKIIPPNNGYITNIYFRNGLEGFSNGIYHTVDGGKTWQKEHEAAWLCFPDNKTGYAAEIRDGGAILRRSF